MTTMGTSLLAVLVFFGGSSSLHSGVAEGNAGGYGTMLPSTQLSQKQPASSKCDHSQQEKCCTVADVGNWEYIEYTEMSARGRHTVVNMTSAGLQEYTMYFAVKGEYVLLLLTSTLAMNLHDLHYQIGLRDANGGFIFMQEQLPTDHQRSVHDIFTTNIISAERYSYYYLTISGDTLQVGRRGEPPLMTHTSTELRRLKYFSFRWGGSTEGEALYDCTAE